MTTEGKPGYGPGMRDMKKICLIDSPVTLKAAFEELGCEVLALNGSPEPFLALDETLAERGFAPDLVMQVESLGPRCLVTGLDGLDCPALLWCIDPHLNGYWHGAYARLFDLTCSTQLASVPVLRQRGARDVRWLPTFGHGSASPDHAARAWDAAFVGRLTAERPARTWMVRLLEERCAGYALAVRQGLTFGAMMDLYRDARIIPNQSILGEVNFRLFEGASCGCLVLSEALGEEQETLFAPGREFDTYGDAVELDEKLTMYLKNPRLTQAMGRAARERVLAEHTALHRARRILEWARDAVDGRARGRDADLWTALTAAAMQEGGVIGISAGEALARLAGCGCDPATADIFADVACAILRVQAVDGKTGPMASTMDALLAVGMCADSPGVNLTGSMAALRLGRFDAARAFWYRHVKAMGISNPGQPDTPAALLTLWARDLSRRGRVVRAGFAFDPAVHLPDSAVECLLALLADQPEHLPTLRLLDAMLRPLPGLSQLRVGFLSVLTLHERKEWRLALELALASLRACRLASGLDELALARTLARSQGQDSAFARALAVGDRSGLLAARLGA
ncbi:MAG: glycosyltransferase [Pseudodesulfovibrio sp.]|uniref:Spore protein YkvP/CgeB glycosyl transferase-like domain-containing protein n=2 Tax=Pseudodesulfovibrio aespoeensis TaxID=182210 RepID=E6VWY2_PSEA9|nr:MULTISPECIES: glycosyltransferase [Pseudodesulfovibrio]MBU4192892.1 glycosyltransferase [Pseudomonadota bacterium]ADU61388.1 hypothetical protein Daes_0363 [Pseudodesulfovibrio aespoeensis Aspo-2]MBU4242962.1 glycosyltransferase [Pseudomonadota bacterium]MBU4378620.1 glycosyltransferase [Pseudomonadota bacterium]MBU4474781.1 glycosyltransferase [Pseudomonadota bacterium]